MTYKFFKKFIYTQSKIKLSIYMLFVYLSNNIDLIGELTLETKKITVIFPMVVILLTKVHSPIMNWEYVVYTIYSLVWPVFQTVWSCRDGDSDSLRLSPC